MLRWLLLLLRCGSWLLLLHELLKVHLRLLLLLAMLDAWSAASLVLPGGLTVLRRPMLLLACLLLLRLLIVLRLLLSFAVRATPTSQEPRHGSAAAPTPALLYKLSGHQRQPHHRPGGRRDAPEQCQCCCCNDISAHAVLAGCRRHRAAYAAVRGATAATRQARCSAAVLQDWCAGRG